MADVDQPLACMLEVHRHPDADRRLDLAEAPNEAVPGISSAAWARLGLQEPELPALLASIESEFNDLYAVLKPAKEAP